MLSISIPSSQAEAKALGNVLVRYFVISHSRRTLARLLLIIQPKPIRKTFPMGEALHFTPDEARQEEERAKSTSCPGAQTSTRRAPWSCTQLSPFLLVSVGFTSRPCPVEQLLPGRDFTARPSPARQTTPFFIFFFEGKRACCLPSSYVFTLPLFLPFFPLFSCHLCSLWKAGAAA